MNKIIKFIRKVIKFEIFPDLKKNVFAEAIRK